ncbi:MAG: antibiotic biosynthesis monooxygenase [Hyphomicrobiales bacterium]
MTGSEPNHPIVTRLIAYTVKPGRDAEFEAWQNYVSRQLQNFPGALRADVLPAAMTELGHEWIVINRFATEAQLNAWLNSRERAEALSEAPDILIGQETQYTLVGAESKDAGETIVTSNEVIPGKEPEYEAADRALNEAAARFPGFVSAKLYKPASAGDRWSTMIRFDSKTNMDRWLASPERAAGRKVMYRFTVSHKANVIPTGFGSWFAVNAEDSIAAPTWKQAMVVLAALYPLVMFLNLTIGVALSGRGLPFAADVFVGNALSTAALSWLLMPIATRAMAWWLSPRCNTTNTLLGACLLLIVYAAEVAIVLSLHASI